jgi:hypothetical protein
MSEPVSSVPTDVESVPLPTAADETTILLDPELSMDLLRYWQDNKLSSGIYTTIVRVVGRMNSDGKNVIIRARQKRNMDKVESIICDFDIGRELSVLPDIEKYIDHILMMKLRYFPNMPWKFCFMKSYGNKEYSEIKYSVFDEFEMEYSSFMTELFDRLIEPPRWFAAMDMVRRQSVFGSRW